jgi:uncharacterized membrane protein YkvA (DUF1232 family)
MDRLLQMMQSLMFCGTALVTVFVVLLALPQSKLREVLMPIVGWAVAIFCGFYCVSPVDVVPEALLGPFGLVDDLGALALGISAAIAARKASRASSSSM